MMAFPSFVPLNNDKSPSSNLSSPFQTCSLHFICPDATRGATVLMKSGPYLGSSSSTLNPFKEIDLEITANRFYMRYFVRFAPASHEKRQ